MLKKILELKGAEKLSKDKTKRINGGNKMRICCDPACHCCGPTNNYINGKPCYPYSSPPACI